MKQPSINTEDASGTINRRIITFVSAPLLPNMVAFLHLLVATDRYFLPTEKTPTTEMLGGPE